VQIYNVQTFTGRNIFSHRPVIKMAVDIGDLYDIPTKDIKDFNKNLLSLLPGLKKHYCSLGYEGGFVERLEEGTYIAHVTEHLILELQSISGYEVFYGKTRVAFEPSLYNIIFEYKNERCGVECGRAAISIIDSLVKNMPVDSAGILERIRKASTEAELGPSTKAVFEEAAKRGIPVTRMGNESLLQLGYGKYLRLVEASLPDSTSCIAVDIAGNKHLTKQLLSDNNIPVPYGEIAFSEEAAVELAKEIGYPVVIKPLDGNQGKGVTLNITDDMQVRIAYNEAIKHSKAVIVESYIKGKDYRILVIGGKVSAVSERKPPSVSGDGVHTVGELVEFENSNVLRGEDHERPLTKIKLDSVAKQVLLRNDLDENYIPKKGEVVNLRDNANLSTGGTARDCTDEIHPYNSLIAVKAAKAVGLDIAGIDMTIEDISVPISRRNGAVIEVNAAPGLRMHLYPTSGKAQNVAQDIVDMLFPSGQPFTIPIVSITGTNGKTTTTRLVRHTLSLTGKKVGMTSTSGIYVGNECILKGDNTGPVSARMVLSNREVEVAVLETARGGIVRKGLGYDLADVGVVVNIAEDHIGLDGVKSLEDLAFAKALVIEAVKPDGYAVLNADDEMTEYLMKRAVSPVILFSREKDNELVNKHINSGGTAVYVEDGIIYINDGERKIKLIHVEKIPITFGGIVECNVENSLAAVSALFAMDIPLSFIKMGLETFKPDIMTNPGRFNIFDMGNFKVMLDYSHNPADYKAVFRFIQKMGAARLVGVIGMPGDRMDKNIMEVGEICSKAFSQIYIKEDVDLRGRKQGEVAGILYNTILEKGCRKENVQVIYSEIKALETAILDAQPGDLIIMFYEEFEPAVELVNRFRQELEESGAQEVSIVEAEESTAGNPLKLQG